MQRGRRAVGEDVQREGEEDDVAILPSDLAHAEERGTTSLLPQFYGLYTVKFDGARPLSFIVMNYWFASSKNIERRFDLKGSTWSPRERERAQGTGVHLQG